VKGALRLTMRRRSSPTPMIK